jgi:hypothetical protein
LANIAHRHVDASGRSKGWAQRFKAALDAKTLDAELYAKWDKLRLKGNFSRPAARAGIRKEQLALETQMDSQIQGARSERIETTGTDTNTRVQSIERTVNEHGELFIGGNLPDDLTPVEVSRAVRTAKGPLTSAKQQADETMKAEKDALAESRAAAKEARAERMTQAADRIAIAANCIQNAPPSAKAAARKQRLAEQRAAVQREAATEEEQQARRDAGRPPADPVAVAAAEAEKADKKAKKAEAAKVAKAAKAAAKAKAKAEAKAKAAATPPAAAAAVDNDAD